MLSRFVQYERETHDSFLPVEHFSNVQYLGGVLRHCWTNRRRNVGLLVGSSAKDQSRLLVQVKTQASDFLGLDANMRSSHY